MKKNLSFFILFFFTLCFSQDEYFRQLKKRIEFNINHEKPLKNISDAEKEKFEKTKDTIYYISYKYTLAFSLVQENKDKIQHFLTLSELLRANNNRYSVVTTDVNLALALQLENYSHDMSFDYINKSIENEEKIKNSRSLPHLYHFKGRLYFNIGKYDKALEYFRKALLLYIPEEYLYISSMHNNFGLVYEDQKNRQSYTRI
ncbi:tetratricopeptide repeat protein [Chryseobacterium sp. SL1]|uniref:tetratricopeptide repeat protein n=1 Tax=Chryseobacterium sp. SL1 TaxID=2995159 RepID=UPI0022747197|nr:tetratricopeptide repeat protein [Chryseobacterium sp. SL1]MCY1660429.1 tetratricopeptide repeat protein [Chryseobacterium sp. SL1]